MKSLRPAAFGLFDMNAGNVWEWVDDYYGSYPWPPVSGFSRVYRGGSWSRRFEKWLHTRLRNRESERFSGSHLGMRCASSPGGVKCPFGVDAAGWVPTGRARACLRAAARLERRPLCQARRATLPRGLDGGYQSRLRARRRSASAGSRSGG